MEFFFISDLACVRVAVGTGLAQCWGLAGGTEELYGIKALSV